LSRRTALLVLAAAACVAAAPVPDDAGHLLAGEPPARRIVALAPHLAELVHAAGAGGALVGSVRGSDYPASVRVLPSVGDAAGIDAERVLALRPDLVLAWTSGNRAADLARLERAGLRLFYSEPRTLADVGRSLRRIGALAGTAQAGEAAARRFETALARLSAPAPGARSPGVFVQIWSNPLMTVNGEHLISEIVSRCGGRNVFADLPVLAGSVDLEAMLAADPELVLAVVAPGQEQAALARWQRWPQLRAVSGARLHAVNGDLVTRATPRVLDGAQRVCAWIDAARRAPR
jgi:iron complex transport system substrate-binding protein